MKVIKSKTSIKNKFLNSQFKTELIELFKKHNATIEKSPVYKNSFIVGYRETLIIDKMPVLIDLSSIFEELGKSVSDV